MKMVYDKVLRARFRYFNSFCSKTVSEYLTRDQNLSMDEKSKIIMIAKKNVDSIGKFRVHWSDFQEALRLWRKQRLEKKKLKENEQ